jgi:ABC-type cobalamin transport system ATPase subunit
MTQLAERIHRITPQFHPTNEDLLWFEAELDRAQERLLPRLIRRRFVEVLKASGKARFQAGTITNQKTPQVVQSK